MLERISLSKVCNPDTTEFAVCVPAVETKLTRQFCGVTLVLEAQVTPKEQ